MLTKELTKEDIVGIIKNKSGEYKIEDDLKDFIGGDMSEEIERAIETKVIKSLSEIYKVEPESLNIKMSFTDEKLHIEARNELSHSVLTDSNIPLTKTKPIPERIYTSEDVAEIISNKLKSVNLVKELRRELSLPVSDKNVQFLAQKLFTIIQRIYRINVMDLKFSIEAVPGDLMAIYPENELTEAILIDSEYFKPNYV